MNVGIVTSIQEVEEEEDDDSTSFEKFKDQNRKKYDVEDPGCTCNMASFVLLIALSTHAIFEGIALGLTSDTAAVINIMIALILHKTAASMSLGISLSRSFSQPSERRHAILLLFVFAFATPTGIGLGMALSNTKTIVEIVFSSFAGGT